MTFPDVGEFLPTEHRESKRLEILRPDLDRQHRRREGILDTVSPDVQSLSSTQLQVRGKRRLSRAEIHETGPAEQAQLRRDPHQRDGRRVVIADARRSRVGALLADGSQFRTALTDGEHGAAYRGHGAPLARMSVAAVIVRLPHASAARLA